MQAPSWLRAYAAGGADQGQRLARPRLQVSHSRLYHCRPENRESSTGPKHVRCGASEANEDTLHPRDPDNSTRRQREGRHAAAAPNRANERARDAMPARVLGHLKRP